MPNMPTTDQTSSASQGENSSGKSVTPSSTKASTNVRDDQVEGWDPGHSDPADLILVLNGKGQPVGRISNPPKTITNDPNGRLWNYLETGPQHLSDR
jgi:hypothetical protein